MRRDIVGVQGQCNDSAVYVLSGAGSKYVTRNLRMKVGRLLVVWWQLFVAAPRCRRVQHMHHLRAAHIFQLETEMQGTEAPYARTMLPCASLMWQPPDMDARRNVLIYSQADWRHPLTIGGVDARLLRCAEFLHSASFPLVPASLKFEIISKHHQAYR